MPEKRFHAVLGCAESGCAASLTCMRGLVGDSMMTSFVLPGMMARRVASRSVMSTLVTLTPALGTTCTVCETMCATWSHERQCVRRAIQDHAAQVSVVCVCVCMCVCQLRGCQQPSTKLTACVPVCVCVCVRVYIPGTTIVMCPHRCPPLPQCAPQLTRAYTPTQHTHTHTHDHIHHQQHSLACSFPSRNPSVCARARVCVGFCACVTVCVCVCVSHPPPQWPPCHS